MAGRHHEVFQQIVTEEEQWTREHGWRIYSIILPLYETARWPPGPETLYFLDPRRVPPFSLAPLEAYGGGGGLPTPPPIQPFVQNNLENQQRYMKSE